MKETILKVDGMMCEGCENRIKSALKNIDGIEKVEARHKDGTVKIIANENVKNEIIKNTINDIGFEVIKED